MNKQLEFLSNEIIKLTDNSTHFHEATDWSERFARKIERLTLESVIRWLTENYKDSLGTGREFAEEIFENILYKTSKE